MSLRTIYCGEARTSHQGQFHQVCGWVHRRRDHGGVVFVDLRDIRGLIQVVFNPDKPQLFSLAESLRNEYVLWVRGTIRLRPTGTINVELPTGTIELLADELEILNTSATPPFLLDDEKLSEQVRLTHRVIDLRRPAMQANLLLRFRLTQAIRDFLNRHEFIDIETPMLTRSTPEGARDYLVPSRVHVGEFFALPQSPQLFKQMLMMASFDRYYQITRCFRDEDLRADRQPEFTQVDIETSFLTSEDIVALMEEMVREVFRKVLKVELPSIPHMSFDEAMSRYGSDKPDLRVTLELTELTDLMKTEQFEVMRNAAELPDGRVAALKVPDGETMTRGEINQYTEFVATYGAKGLAYIKVSDPANIESGLQSPILKFLSKDCILGILERTGAQAGDLIFFGAGPSTVVNNSLSALREKVGQERNHTTGAAWAPLWIVDFPMFEWSAEDKRWQARHHPFTAPKPGHEALLESAPEKCQAQAYDLVLNGWEIGGGSVRIHRAQVQSQVFATLGIGEAEAKAKFGFLLDALRYGAPPHGGIAFGLDRLAALMAGVESIRDVIAFPKTQRAQCLLTNAPSPVDEKQLRELHIRLRQPAVEIK